MVWGKGCIPKLAFTLWLAVQGKLMTKDRLRKWGMQNVDLTCVLCGGIESVDHLFFACTFAKSVWQKVPKKNVSFI